MGSLCAFVGGDLLWHRGGHQWAEDWVWEELGPPTSPFGFAEGPPSHPSFDRARSTVKLLDRFFFVDFDDRWETSDDPNPP